MIERIFETDLALSLSLMIYCRLHSIKIRISIHEKIFPFKLLSWCANNRLRRQNETESLSHWPIQHIAFRSHRCLCNILLFANLFIASKRKRWKWSVNWSWDCNKQEFYDQGESDRNFWDFSSSCTGIHLNRF